MKKSTNTKKARGFTIVELLVVIVVIGILAAISIVSYSGVTNKANTTKALQNASTVRTVADVYFAEKGYYPAATASTAMTTGDWPTSSSTTATAKLTAGLSVIRTVVAVANQATNISIECKTTCTTTTGLRIGYYDSTIATPYQAYLYTGDAKSTDTFVFPAS